MNLATQDAREHRKNDDRIFLRVPYVNDAFTNQVRTILQRSNLSFDIALNFVALSNVVNTVSVTTKIYAT